MAATVAFSPEQVDSGNPGNFNQKRLRGGVHSLPRLTDFASSTCSRSVNGCDVRPRSRLGASHLLAINSTKRSRSRSSSSIPRLSNYQQEILTWKCNHCSIVLRNTRFKIKFQKWYHITKTHPHIDKSEFDQMRTLISTMVTPTNIPRALRLCQIRSWSTIGHEVHCKKKCSTEAFEDMLWQAHDHA